MFIYCFTNPETNNKYIGKYVGSERQLFKRYQHEVDETNSQRHIIRALRKHGIDNFRFEIIKDQINDKVTLANLEKHFIKFFNSKNSGYNMTPGGDGGDTFTGKTLTDEHKEKIRRGNKGKKRSSETRLNIKIACSKRIDDENYQTRYKDGMAKRDIKGSKNGMFGRKHSEEAKRKISLARQAMKKHGAE